MYVLSQVALCIICYNETNETPPDVQLPIEAGLTLDIKRAVVNGLVTICRMPNGFPKLIMGQQLINALAKCG